MSRISVDVRWVLLGTVVAATLALVGPPDPVRVLPGLAATLFLPGYALSIALFPDAEFDTPERLALAFGLSLALIVVAAILLLWVPWRSEAVPIVGIAGMTVAFCLVAELRRRTPGHGSSAQAAIPRDHSALPTGLAGVLFPVFTLVVILALAGGGISLALYPPSRATEFYALGVEGLSEKYPSQVVAGRPSVLNIGIVNGEARPTTFRVDVNLGAETAGTTGPMALDEEEEWRGSVEFVVPSAGVDQQLAVVLYKGDSLEPFRRLRLWVDAAPSQ
jgi:uncharacterized membrane protein